MIDFDKGPNYRFLLDFMASEEDPCLGYIFLRAINIFYRHSFLDPTVFLSMRYLEIILAFGFINLCLILLDSFSTSPLISARCRVTTITPVPALNA